MGLIKLVGWMWFGVVFVVSGVGCRVSGAGHRWWWRNRGARRVELGTHVVTLVTRH